MVMIMMIITALTFQRVNSRGQAKCRPLTQVPTWTAGFLSYHQDQDGDGDDCDHNHDHDDLLTMVAGNYNRFRHHREVQSMG